MQTFLPYQSFTKSLECLDNKRLGKQRVEAMQILNALKPGSESRWRNHPAVKMWRGHRELLWFYHDLAIYYWMKRGFNNSMRPLYFYTSNSNELIEYPEDMDDEEKLVFKLYNLPPWLTEEFCAAHRSNLLRKDPEFYGKYGWSEPDDLPYIWPV